MHLELWNEQIIFWNLDMLFNVKVNIYFEFLGFFQWRAELSGNGRAKN